MKNYKFRKVILFFMIFSMSFLFQGCSRKPNDDLCKAVANVEEIHRLCMYSKVHPKDVPVLCAEAVDMAGRRSNDEVLTKAVDEACAYATWRLDETPNYTYKNEYKEIEGSREIYDLAAIRMNLKKARKNDDLHRLVTGELADWERAEIENNKELFVSGIVGYSLLGVICVLILLSAVSKIKNSFWFHF